MTDNYSYKKAENTYYCSDIISTSIFFLKKQVVKICYPRKNYQSYFTEILRMVVAKKFIF